MSKYRKSARLQDCQVRIPGVCSHDPETVVLAHLGGHLAGAGMSTKGPDIHAAFCCAKCHDVIDGRVPAYGYSREALRLMHLEGVIRTQRIWIQDGLLKP